MPTAASVRREPTFFGFPVNRWNLLFFVVVVFWVDRCWVSRVSLRLVRLVSLSRSRRLADSRHRLTKEEGGAKCTELSERRNTRTD